MIFKLFLQDSAHFFDGFHLQIGATSHVFNLRVQDALSGIIATLAELLDHPAFNLVGEFHEFNVFFVYVDKLGVSEAEVTAEASFQNDLGADSLDTVELIMEFEKEFDIQIPDDQAENIATVGQAVSYIEAAKA